MARVAAALIGSGYHSLGNNMSKRLALAMAVSLAAVGSAHAATKTPTWIERSNTDSKVMLDVLAKFSPEFASQIGLP